MMKKSVFFLLLFSTFFQLAEGKVYRFLVGTYTQNTVSEGIYSINFDAESGVFKIQLAATDVDNPSFLAFSPDRNFVYAVNELGFESRITSFRFDAPSGKLYFINDVNADGSDPCFISASEHHIITANYSSGSACVFKRNRDGSIGESVQKIQFEGHGIDSSRQKSPHVHQTIFSPCGQFLLINDLGTDFIRSFLYFPEKLQNCLSPFDSLKVKPGSGPRHLAFSKDRKYLYLLHELDGTISIIRFNKGNLEFSGETSLVTNKNLKTGAADIHISPDGKFLYATNRGESNNITCFRIQKNGSLEFVEQIPTQGNGPRNFVITKDGNYLLVGNQYSDKIVVFKRDRKSGKLTDTEIRMEVGAPVCLLEY
ncbi:MAG TPA: lactonase family protein [Paludibacteraceae bacterium]|nr:lactonase family protein [Paludibacteraceae bacterium]